MFIWTSNQLDLDKTSSANQVEHHQFESVPTTGIFEFCGIRNPIRMNDRIPINNFFFTK